MILPSSPCHSTTSKASQCGRDIHTHTGLRDRALLGTLAYTFARIGSVVNLKVEDYFPSGKRFLLWFKEKGGKEKELPVHHKLEELLDRSESWCPH